jgi:hypothetical protein
MAARFFSLQNSLFVLNSGVLLFGLYIHIDINVAGAIHLGKWAESLGSLKTSTSFHFSFPFYRKIRFNLQPAVLFLFSTALYAQQMITQDLSREPSSTSSPGEMHVSLCYHPSADRFTVTVLQARNIKVGLLLFFPSFFLLSAHKPVCV